MNDFLRQRLFTQESRAWAEQRSSDVRIQQAYGVVVGRSSAGWEVECLDGSRVVSPSLHTTSPIAVGQRVDLVFRDGKASIDFRPSALQAVVPVQTVQQQIPLSCEDIAGRIYAELIRRGHRTLSTKPDALFELRALVCDLFSRGLWQCLDCWYVLDQSIDNEAWKLNLVTLNPLDDLSVLRAGQVDAYSGSGSKRASYVSSEGKLIRFYYPWVGIKSDVELPEYGLYPYFNVPDYGDSSMLINLTPRIGKYLGSAYPFQNSSLGVSIAEPQFFENLDDLGSFYPYADGREVYRITWGGYSAFKTYLRPTRSWPLTVVEGLRNSQISLEGKGRPGETGCFCLDVLMGGRSTSLTPLEVIFLRDAALSMRRILRDR